ncbi:MAG: hypothetical protein Q4C98_10945 [Capnocytophaga sp.]|nr:hypothetical protein [Capnocytophaga sp.]
MWNKIKSLLKVQSKTYACSIYRTDAEYKIITESKTDTGLFMADTPVYIIPISVSEKELSDKIFSSLFSSKDNVKFPATKSEMTEYQKEHLKNIKEKSFSNLYKNSTNCSIRLTNNIITIIPNKLNKIWLEPVEKDIKEMEYDNNELQITKIIISLLENY